MDMCINRPPAPFDPHTHTRTEGQRKTVSVDPGAVTCLVVLVVVVVVAVAIAVAVTIATVIAVVVSSSS